jgi:para-aminobenzoate synthetase / 4-amino-4-deoxychorismate lyase
MPPELVRLPLPGSVPAERAALLVAGDRRPFALCGNWAGSRAVVGSDPLHTAPPFTALTDPSARGWAVWHQEIGWKTAHPQEAVVGGGWFGVLGFPLGRDVERIGDPPPRPIPSPPSSMAFYDHVLRLDRDGQWWFEALWTEEREEALEERRAALAARLERGVPGPGDVRTAPWRSVPGPAGHAAAVEAAKRRIAAGDLFQVNLTLRLESELREGSAADLFLRGVEALRPDRAAFFADGERAVVSLSPELFLERRGRRVVSAPIKGTGRDPAALAVSAKDRAENVMIVDLVRNDLGRVCEPGSIHVPALADARPHTGVWHLVSEVAGTLRAGATDADLVRAAFPPGSVTGAPKVAALDVIAELESTGREAYTGAIGFASPVAGLELNVAIRTFELHGDRIWLGVGGGVVADSDPAAEAAEAATKAAPLLAAIGGRLAPPPKRSRQAPSPLRLAPKPIPRPDPARGVFETILARDGDPVRLDDHLDRLAASVEGLYGEATGLGGEAAEVGGGAARIGGGAGRVGGIAPLLAEAAALVERAAAGVGDGRVRLDARPARLDARPAAGDRRFGGGGAVVLEVRSGPLPEAVPLDAPDYDRPQLRAVCVPGGLGPHKFADRRLIDALTEAATPKIPLLVDLDGLVLEASYANVVIVEGDRIITPPHDGRILPGIGLRTLAAHQEPIDLDRLNAADAVVLVNALRGVQPVRGDHDLIAATISSGASSWM